MAPATHPLRLSLEFERGAAPIAGHLSDESGRRWDFVGWMELATALEEALGEQPPPCELPAGT